MVLFRQDQGVCKFRNKCTRKRLCYPNPVLLTENLVFQPFDFVSTFPFCSQVLFYASRSSAARFLCFLPSVSVDLVVPPDYRENQFALPSDLATKKWLSPKPENFFFFI